MLSKLSGNLVADRYDSVYLATYRNTMNKLIDEFLLLPRHVLGNVHFKRFSSKLFDNRWIY